MSRWFRQFGFAEVDEDLLVGAYPLDRDDVGMIAAARAEVVYNLCEDAEYDEGERRAVTLALGEAGLDERRAELVDYGSLPLPVLDRAVREVLGELEGGRRVYLHCRAGWQRSAAVAAGVLALRRGVGIEEALERLRERKPTSQPLAHQREDLLAWWRSRETSPGGGGA
jgi:protein-tyrosine phosphatase